LDRDNGALEADKDTMAGDTGMMDAGKAAMSQQNLKNG
jgi:hypothetical protein